MSIDMSQYARAGDSFAFENVGDTIKGEIVQVKDPHVRVNKFTDKDETVMAITIRTEGGDEYSIWPRLQPYSSMGGAIADATAAHGHKLEVGGKLAVQFTEEKDTGKGRPAKLYAAAYEPPAKGVSLASVGSAPAAAKPDLGAF
jgi:hypothetical protein